MASTAAPDYPPKALTLSQITPSSELHLHNNNNNNDNNNNNNNNNNKEFITVPSLAGSSPVISEILHV